MQGFDATSTLDAPVLSLRVPGANGERHQVFEYSRYNWQGFASDYAVIQLSKGYFTIVDRSDYASLSKYRWYANVQRHPETKEIVNIYAVRDVRKKGKKRSLYMHRVIMRDKVGSAHKVDHKNFFTLDNRKQNLRTVNHSENIANSGGGPPRTKNKHLPRGIHPIHTKKGTRYQALIRPNGKVYQRVFDSVERAKTWYDRMYRRLFRFCSYGNDSGRPSLPVFPPLVGDTEAIPF